MDHYNTTITTWNKIANIYQDKFMDLDLYNDTYDLFCQQIDKPKAHILEIGCGPGNITRYLLAQRPDFIVHATDVAPNMIKLAKENNPNATCTVLDCRNIYTLPIKYDAIMCGFCIPYLCKEDVATLIKNCANLMYTHGVLYFSVIEGDYNKSDYQTGSSGDKAYVYYYHEDYFNTLLYNTGFERVAIEKKSYIKSNDLTETHIIFIARKK